MSHLKKTGFILIIGLMIILIRHYEYKTQQKRAFESRKISELVRVVDGDTIVVDIDDQEEKIRIIGINAPESVKPNHPVECFGKEASDHLKEILSNNDVLIIESDPTQGARDRHGRLLAHVFVEEKNIAQQMIANGYAYEYTYREPYMYQQEYRNAEKSARNNERGLWSSGACNSQK